MTNSHPTNNTINTTANSYLVPVEDSASMRYRNHQLPNNNFVHQMSSQQSQHQAAPPASVRSATYATSSASMPTTAGYSSIPVARPMLVERPKHTLRKRRYAINTRLEHLEKMLDMTKFIEQLERLIEQPIKIPGTLSMCPGHSREKQVPGKAKRDLLSVQDIWEKREDQKADTSSLYNVGTVGERKWLLDLLLEESDADSGGDENITSQDLKELLKIHQKRRKFQKDYHSDILNSQYTYYGAGLISTCDNFPEHQQKVKKEFL
uniref:BHLH domain-containing protein n=1 Tax=Ditylenchus dipsaci TaxID=166011 RepID=A0A915CWU4_9BILA